MDTSVILEHRSTRRRRSAHKADPLDSDEEDKPASSSQPRTVQKRQHRYRQQGPIESSSRLPSNSRTLSSSQPKSSIVQPGSIEDTLGGFFPKLGRIFESKEVLQERHHRRRSTLTTIDEKPPHLHQTHNTYEHRGAYGHVGSRRAGRYKQNSLQYHLSARSNPSLQSLLSTLTKNSSGSSGSNSTVTQKSFDRSAVSKKGRRSKQRINFAQQDSKLKRRNLKQVSKMQRRDSKYETDVEESIKEEGKSTTIRRPGSTSSNDEDRPSPDTSSEREAINTRSSPSAPQDRFGLRESWKRQETFNSDSGISVSSSPEVRIDPTKSEGMRSGQDSDSDSVSSSSSSSEDDSDEENEDEEMSSRPVPTARSSSGTVTTGAQSPKALPDNDSLVQRLREQENDVRQHILHSPRPQRSLRTQATSTLQPVSPLPLFEHQTSQVPYPYPPPHAPNVPHGDHIYGYQPFTQSMQHHLPPDAPFGLDLKKTTIAGYELVASKLASREVNEDSDNIQPIYRRFEHLNHRVLLHLQDEIAELEEELRILDESIAQMTPFTEGDALQPASRRAEARFGSELHFRRTEVLGKVFVKLGQYNQALASYNNASRSFVPAGTPDIAAYRRFMEENTPIEKLEARFLNHERDLMAMSTDRSPARSRSFNVRHTVIALSILVLLPLVLFMMVPGFLARMLVLVAVGCSGIAIASSHGLAEDMTPQDFALVASLYFGVMSLTAVVS